MPVKVAKEFRWEMGHRLPYHDLCRNVHGHSYRMVVEVEGEPDDRGMVVDFADIGRAVKPLVEQMDHAFMIDPWDDAVRTLLCEEGLKVLPVPFHTTAENIARWIADSTQERLFARSNVAAVAIRVFETATASAVVRIERPQGAQKPV